MIARREREAALRHPWIVDMAKHRAHAMVGPNVLRHLDQAMAALAGLKLEPREALKVLDAVDDYMFGFTARERASRRCSGAMSRLPTPTGAGPALAARRHRA